jgi:FAD/FMN-containing dehydrogenase
MPSAQILEALRKLFLSELVLVKGTAQYDQSNESYLSARESEISPSIIVRPRSKEDVASFVRIIKSSEYHDIKFAVRGAGQQPLPGCANIDGGITLDLSLLTGIVPDADSGIVTIAAGERWGAIYEELDGTGLGIGGARSAKGGIGGLSLAGT